MSQFDLSMTGSQIVLASSLQGVGQGILFVPLATLGFSTVSRSLRPDASALTNLTRNLGGSIGVAAIQALTVTNIQTIHASLATHITATTPMIAAALTEILPAQGLVAINAEITRQATMLAYVDDFWLMTILSMMCLALALLLRQRQAKDMAQRLPG